MGEEKEGGEIITTKEEKNPGKLIQDMNRLLFHPKLFSFSSQGFKENTALISSDFKLDKLEILKKGKN